MKKQVILQGIIDLAFLEEDGYVIVDYKSNMVAEAQLAQLAEHYRLQMQLYRLALEQVSGRPVKPAICGSCGRSGSSQFIYKIEKIPA